MSTPRPTARITTGFEDLLTGLRVWARGLLCLQAAVELLISHRHWLWRQDFGDVALTRGRLVFTGERYITVNFLAAAEALEAGALPCSPDERQTLLIAASIAEGNPIDLRAACEHLAAGSLALVIDALCAAACVDLAVLPARMS